jgi:hypothetical protein
MLIQTLAGAGAQRGAAHGTVRSTAIQQTLDALRAHLDAAGHNARELGRHLVSSPLCTAARTHTPDLWDEVEATAEGAAITLDDVLLLTFLDEVWGLADSVGCSVLARQRSGSGTEVGQTMDLPQWASGRLTVLRVEPPAHPVALVMSYPGMVGLCGANDAGLGVAVNALPQFGLSESGLGAAFIVRHLLTLSTLDAAVAFLGGVPHAVGQAYTVAAQGEVVTFEAGPDVFQRVSEGPSCIHTNHPLDRSPRPASSTMTRLIALQHSVDESVDVETALSGDVVLDGSRYGDPNSTFAAFRARSDDPFVAFIDGRDLQSGGQEWTHVSFR